MVTLGIESSCDETAVALIDGERRILADFVLSQVKVHSRFGGVVPELASREHLKSIVPLYRMAMEEAGLSLDDVDLIAVTEGPGLIGSLLVGLCFAKALSYFGGKPIVGVDHVRAHVFSVFFTSPVEFPFISLVVSGGHTVLFEVRDYDEVITLGHTRDDAAGEAFDKVAKLLGLGYPGGVEIDRLSRDGDSSFVQFPRPFMRGKNLEFSFSGLKTAVLNYVRSEGLEKVRRNIAHVCASFQEAVVDVLVGKLLLAASDRGIRRVSIAGGVAANSRLREKLMEACEREGLELHLPERKFCTDNALMVAYLGQRLYDKGVESGLDLNAYANIRY